MVATQSAIRSVPRACRVLLVDDEAGVRESLPPLLERWGYTVVGTLGSADALARSLILDHPDVVILDIDMPGRSPFHAMQDLRYRGSPAKVLVLSALGDAPTVRACFEAGADGYVLKMDAPDDLRDGLEAVLAGRGYRSTRLAFTP